MSASAPLIQSALADTISTWLLQAVVYGSVVAALTWLLIKTVFRKARPAVHALLWLVVLVKFIIPWGPGASFSLSTLVGDWTGLNAAAPIVPIAAPAGPPAVNDAGGVAYVFVNECAPAAAVATQHPSAAPAPPWSALTWVMLAYLALVALLAAVRIAAYIRFVRRCAAYPAADDSALAVVAAVCGRLGVRRMPRVSVSDSASAPFVMGVLRPRLVLARRHLADAVELEAVVLHEIAHLRRGDLLVRHLQWLAGTLLFFWPVVAWVNRRIDLLREYACDEWALRHGRLSAGDYARCLLRAVQPVRSRWMQFRPAAMAATRVNVERRIDMILNAQTRASRRWMWLPIGSAVAVWGAFVLAGAAPADGAAAKSAKSDDPLTWFSNAIESEVNAQNGQGMVVVVNKMIEVNGEAEPQMHVEVLSGNDIGALPAGAWIGGGQQRMFIARTAEGDGEERHCIASFISSADGEQELASFLASHPTADANADGTLNASERDAYLVALAVSDPTAVLNQYPTADRNSDGTLDAEEAARLVTLRPDMDILQPGPGVWTTAMPAMPAMQGAIVEAAPAGAMLKIVAHADVQDGDTQPRVINLRTRIVGPDGEEIQLQGGDAAVKLDELQLPEGCEKRVIVRKIVQGDGPADVQVTVNGQPVDPSEISNIDAHAPMLGGAHAVFQRLHGALGIGGAPGAGCANETFEWKLAAPASEWLADNITSEVSAADVAKLIPTVEQAPLTAFLAANPQADTDNDGRLTAAERAAFIERNTSRARAKLLERFPEADADADGLLTNEELHTYFKNRGPHGKMKIKIEKPADDGGVMGPPMNSPAWSLDGC